jgi:uncharacterized protein YehS (DUF1456 family)
MRLATQSSSQLQTIFGNGFIVEQRGDETCRNLPPREPGLNFSKILDSLRAALSLR